MVEAAHGSIVKVIVETALLTEDEKKQVCQIVLIDGAHYITSTGFPLGATASDINCLRQL